MEILKPKGSLTAQKVSEVAHSTKFRDVYKMKLYRSTKESYHRNLTQAKIADFNEFNFRYLVAGTHK